VVTKVQDIEISDPTITCLFRFNPSTSLWEHLWPTWQRGSVKTKKSEFSLEMEDTYLMCAYVCQVAIFTKYVPLDTTCYLEMNLEIVVFKHKYTILSSTLVHY
jgi:hypothetical protein